MKINPKIYFYKSEECPCCDEHGQVFIKNVQIGHNVESYLQDCFHCDGKGFLYIK